MNTVNKQRLLKHIVWYYLDGPRPSREDKMESEECEILGEIVKRYPTLPTDTNLEKATKAVQYVNECFT